MRRLPSGCRGGNRRAAPSPAARRVLPAGPGRSGTFARSHRGTGCAGGRPRAPAPDPHRQALAPAGIGVGRAGVTEAQPSRGRSRRGSPRRPGRGCPARSRPRPEAWASGAGCPRTGPGGNQAPHRPVPGIGAWARHAAALAAKSRRRDPSGPLDRSPQDGAAGPGRGRFPPAVARLRCRLRPPRYQPARERCSRGVRQGRFQFPAARRDGQHQGVNPPEGQGSNRRQQLAVPCATRSGPPGRCRSADGGSGTRRRSLRPGGSARVMRGCTRSVRHDLDVRGSGPGLRTVTSRAASRPDPSASAGRVAHRGEPAPAAESGGTRDDRANARPTVRLDGCRVRVQVTRASAAVSPRWNRSRQSSGPDPKPVAEREAVERGDQRPGRLERRLGHQVAPHGAEAVLALVGVVAIVSPVVEEGQVDARRQVGQPHACQVLRLRRRPSALLRWLPLLGRSILIKIRFIVAGRRVNVEHAGDDREDPSNSASPGRLNALLSSRDRRAKGPCSRKLDSDLLSLATCSIQSPPKGV